MSDAMRAMRSWERNADGDTITTLDKKQYVIRVYDEHLVPTVVAVFRTERAAREYAAWQDLDRAQIDLEHAVEQIRTRCLFRDPYVQDEFDNMESGAGGGGAW